MDISTVSSIVREFVATISTLGVSVGAVATTLLLLLVSWRSGSSHLLMNRLWMVIQGKRKIDDEVIRKYMDDQDKVHWFQFMEGVYPRTLKNTHELIRWCEGNNIALRDIRACGSNFDAQKPGLHLSKRAYFGLSIFTFLVAVPLLAGGGVFALITLPNSALMHSKESELVFWLRSDQAQAIFADGKAALQVDQCAVEKSTLSRKTGFTPNEVDSLCKFFVKPERQQKIDENITTQREFFGFFALALIFFGFSFLREAKRDAAAFHLSRILVRQAPEKMQVESGAANRTD